MKASKGNKKRFNNSLKRKRPCQYELKDTNVYKVCATCTRSKGSWKKTTIY